MNDDQTKPEQQPSSVPANEGIDIPEKALPPDENRTEPGTMPTPEQALKEGPGQDTTVQEHHTAEDHAEPTSVTDATNDNAIDTQYVDVGGGD